MQLINLREVWLINLLSIVVNSLECHYLWYYKVSGVLILFPGAPNLLQLSLSRHSINNYTHPTISSYSRLPHGGSRVRSVEGENASGARVEGENASPVSSMRMRARTDHSVPYSRLRAARDVTRFQARPGQTEHCAGNTDTIIFLTRLPSLQDSQSTVTLSSR